MKKKIMLSICLYLLPFSAFTEEEKKPTNQEVSEEVSKNTSEDDVAINLPANETLSDLNINEQSSSDLSADNSTFPINTTMGYNLDNADSNYFLQADGGDTLNDAKTRKFNFLIKFPYYQIPTKKIDVKPDKFSFNFTDPLLSITLGDNKYNLSTLTIKDLEKRGGSFNLNYKDKIGLSTLYLLSMPTKDKNPSDNFGANIFIKPSSFLKLSSNFLLTKFEKEKFFIPLKNYTYSVRSTFIIDENNKLDLETATTNKIDNKHLAYLANLDGKNKYFNYAINCFYANPYFIGNYTDKIENSYSDRTKLDGFLQYKLKNFSAKILHVFENNNLNKLASKEKAKRTILSEFNISYPVYFLNTTLAVKTKEAKNLLNKDGHKLNAINLNIAIPIKKYCIDNTIEVGKYKSRMENYFPRNWLGDKLCLKYNPTDNTGLSIYTKLGNVLYEDIFTNSYVAGTDLKLKIEKSFDLTFAYEYSKNIRKTNYLLTGKNPKWIVHYFKEDLTYILPNQHKITLSSHLNKAQDEKKEKAFLFTYTIPFNVPSINRAIH
jgi:hypothetical protein